MNRASKTKQLDGSARQISEMCLLDRPAGGTSSLYLKPWPLHPTLVLWGIGSSLDENLYGHVAGPN